MKLFTKLRVALAPSASELPESLRGLLWITTINLATFVGFCVLLATISSDIFAIVLTSLWVWFTIYRIRRLSK